MKGSKGKQKKITIFIVIVSVIALSIGCVTSSQRSSIASITFQEMIDKTTENNEKAIISVGIIKDGEMSITVYGENSAVLPNKEHVYEIGSITKIFTTALLCKAISERKINLTDSIDKHMELPAKDYYPSYERLATHTSGYKRHYFDWKMASNMFQPKKQLSWFYGITSDDLNTKVGKISLKNKDYPFGYSNFGMSVVGNAVANIYESDYTTIMNNFIVSELKLDNTRITDGTGDLDGYSKWHPTDGYLPVGAINSTISDMMKYLNLHMTEEISYLSLSHKKIADVNATTKKEAEMENRTDAIGIGWFIDTKNNIIWHGGGTRNFNSYMAFDKEKQIGIVILSNLTWGDRVNSLAMGSKLITTLQGKFLGGL